jgi:hypothetical protein
MRQTFAVLLVATSLHLTCTDSFAQGITAVKPIPDYVCMNLAISHKQVIDRSFSVPVYAAPSQDADQLGTASIIPFIKVPFRPGDRYQQMLTLGGQVAWIETKWLRPFSSPYNPKATCSPWIMSNGRPGPKVESNR